MKKFLLIFLLAFVCFFGIDKIYAKTFPSANLHDYSIYVGNTKYSGTGALNDTKNIDNINFMYNIDGSLINKVEYNFYLKKPIDNFSFYLYMTSSNYLSNPGVQHVYVYNKVDYGFYCTIYDRHISSSYGQYFKVSCGSINTINGYLSIEVQMSSGINVYGISDITYDIDDNYYNNVLNETQKESNKKLDESNKLAKDKIEQDKNQHEEIMNDDTSEASGEAESFFSGFSTDTHGLTSIITAPLELIGNIAGSTCSPLQVPLPFVDTNLSLPCMSSIYSEYFGSFLTIYQTITFGIVAYWVCVRIFAMVKDFKNPDHDEVEVMDL